MKGIIHSLKEKLQGKVPSGSKRSNLWPKVRAEHLKSFPRCAVCSGTKSIEVHHMRPFHLHPELELDLNNLITLCEDKKNGLNCHLAIGHLGSFKSFNEKVVEDASLWRDKITHRPTTGE